MAANLDVIKRLEVRADVPGAGEAAATMRSLIGTYDEFSRTVVKAGDSLDKNTKTIVSAEAAYERFLRKMVPGYREMQEFTKGVEQLDRALGQGLGVQQFARNFGLLEARLPSVRDRLRETAEAARQLAEVQAGSLQERTAKDTALVEGVMKQEAARRAAMARAEDERQQRQFDREETYQARIPEVRNYTRDRRAAEEKAIEDEITAVRAGSLAERQAKETAFVNGVIAARQRMAAEAERAWEREQDAAIEAMAREEAAAARLATEENRRLGIRRTELLQRADPVGSAEERYQAAVLDTNRLLEQRRRLGAEFGVTEMQAAKILEHEADVLRRIRADAGGGGGLKLNQASNLGYQLNDIISGLAMGQSPLTILTQQGGQVYQALSDSPGGAAAGVKELGVTVGRWLTPMTVTVGGLTAAVIAGAAAWASYDSSQEKLERRLLGLGRASRTTADQINRIAEAQRADGFSTGQSRELGGVLAATGRIGPEMNRELQSTARDLAATLGIDLAEAGKVLAEGFGSGADGAEKLNQKLLFMGEAGMRTVRSLYEQGRAIEAQKMVQEAYNASLGKASELTGFWRREWDELSARLATGADRLGQGIDRAMGGGTLEQRISDLREKLTAEEAGRGRIGGAFAPVADRTIARLRSEMGALEQEQERRRNMGEKAARDLRSFDLEKIINPARALEDQIRKVTNEASRLREEFNDIAPASENAARVRLAQLDAQQKQLEADRKAGGADMATALDKATFDRMTVGMDSYKRSLAEVNQRFNEQIAQEMRLGTITAERIASLTKIRDLALETVTATARMNAVNQAVESRVLSGLPAPQRDLQRQYQGAGLDNVITQEQERARAATAGKLSEDERQRLQDIVNRRLRADDYLNVATYGEKVAERAAAQKKLAEDYAATPGGTKARLDQERDLTQTNVQKREVTEASRALTMQTEAETRAIGQNVGEQTRLRTEAQQLIAMGRDGEHIKVAAAIREQAKAAGEAALKLAELNAIDKERFDRAQLSRTPNEAAIASSVRSAGLQGTDAGERLAAEMRITQAIKDQNAAYTALASTATPLIDNLVDGTKKWGDVFEDVGKSMQKMVLQAALLGQGPLAAFMGQQGAGGGPGGLLGSLLGAGKGLFASNDNAAAYSAAAAAAAPGVYGPGFAVGGYTGFGSRNQPAGIVHAGEYVINAAATAVLPRSYLDRLNRLPGLAAGGMAGPDVIAPPASGAGSSGGDVIINSKTFNYGNDKVEQKAKRRDDGQIDLITVIAPLVKRTIQQPGGDGNNAIRQTFGGKQAVTGR